MISYVDILQKFWSGVQNSYFVEHFLMTNSENIEIFNSLIIVVDIVFLLFLIDTEKAKNHKIQVV